MLKLAQRDSINQTNNYQSRPDGLTEQMRTTDPNENELDVPSAQFKPTASKTSGTKIRTLSDIKRVCYFRMDPKTEIRLNQVDGGLCTHVVLAFVRISAGGQLVVARESDYSYLEEVAEFKRQFPHTRVMVSVFNEQEFNGFPRLVNPTNKSNNRIEFANSAVAFLKRYHLDGLDLDWEFPNFPKDLSGNRGHERAGLTKILESLRSVFVDEFFNRQLDDEQQLLRRTPNRSSGSVDVDGPYLLTVAIAGQEAVLRSSYELKRITNLCDWLNVMSYDYFLFKPYSPFTGPNSPLFPIVSSHVPVLSKLSLSWTTERLLKEGLDRSKLVMGIPCYARAYRLLFRNTRPAAFTISTGPRGGQIEDYLNYREVLGFLRKEETIVEYDSHARVPYLLTNGGYLWVSYEDQRSVREKVRHIMSAGLGGYMTWNLNSDDFIGASSSANDDIPASTFPLHRAMLAEVDELLKQTVG